MKYSPSPNNDLPLYEKAETMFNKMAISYAVALCNGQNGRYTKHRYKIVIHFKYNRYTGLTRTNAIGIRGLTVKVKMKLYLI